MQEYNEIIDVILNLSTLKKQGKKRNYPPYKKFFILLQKIFIDLEYDISMKRIAIMLSVIFLLTASLKPILPESTLLYTETVEIESIESQYTLDLIVPVCLKKGSTYEDADRRIYIEIGPRKKLVGTGKYFIEVLVAVKITDGQGKTTADFKSYLNCNLEDCDLDAEIFALYWDDIGEKRADKAGELFEEGIPLIVTDKLCEVKITLVNVLSSHYVVESSNIDYESKLECPLAMMGITMEIAVDYSPQQKEVIQALTEAEEFTTTGDQQYQGGELDKAHTAYEKAEALYNQVGDTLRAEEIQSKITDVFTKIGEQHFLLGEQFFVDEEYEKALAEYEKAKAIAAALEDDEMSAKIQLMIDTCNSYLTAENNFKEGIDLFNETGDIPYYEIKIKNYKKAQSWFETAQTEYEVLKDTEKTEECRTWMQNCDAKIDQLVTEHADSTDEPVETPWTCSILGVVIAGAAICIIVLYWGLRPVSRPEPPPQKPESEELRILKYRLVKGEITVEKFEELKSALDEQ
jgi:tetratricopeptide (TPR) repeat protein